MHFLPLGLKSVVLCVQVKVLVEFLINTCMEVFGKEIACLLYPSAEESLVPVDGSTGVQMDRGSSQAGAADLFSLMCYCICEKLRSF